MRWLLRDTSVQKKKRIRLEEIDDCGSALWRKWEERFCPGTTTTRNSGNSFVAQSAAVEAASGRAWLKSQLQIKMRIS